MPKKPKSFAETAFDRGMRELIRAFLSYEKAHSKPGEGHYARLWPDGSGHIVLEAIEGEREMFFFNRPAELWTWLNADPQQRETMNRASLRREGKESQRLDDFIAKEIAKGKVQ